MATNFEVRQESLLSAKDGSTPPAPLFRGGFQALAKPWDLLALQGRMFNLQQGTIGTAVDGSAAAVGAIVLTAPTVRFTVPTGYTVLMRHLNVALASAAGTDNEIALICSNTDSFTSDGVALTPKNWRTDAPRASIVTNCVIGSVTPIVEAALTTERALYQDVVPAAFAASKVSDYRVDVWFDVMRPIIGPASVLLFVAGATTTPSFYFSLDWAEVATVNVKIV